MFPGLTKFFWFSLRATLQAAVSSSFMFLIDISPHVPQVNHLLQVPAAGALLGSAHGTQCKRGDESSECGSPQPLTSPRPMLSLSLHGASSLTCRECGLRTSPETALLLGSSGLCAVPVCSSRLSLAQQENSQPGELFHGSMSRD